MKIDCVRRISQVFFFLLFLWFCIVGTLGTEWWRLRGWPVNWFLQLDPLVALGTILTTGALYSGLLWALATVVTTILLGRFFCGWVCPFGSIHHFVGYVGRRGRPVSEQAAVNGYHPGQAVKYYILAFLLAACAGALIARLLKAGLGGAPGVWLMAAASAGVALLSIYKVSPKPGKASGALLALLGFWTVLAFFLSLDRMVGASLQTGLLDPIPLVYRSVNLVLLPLADASGQRLAPAMRFYGGAWLIGGIFLAAVLLNLIRPRFYCRFICPLGALYGVLGRFAPWRVGKTRNECSRCGLCNTGCEGACEPSGQIRSHECVLCMNCLHDCGHDLIAYRTSRSASSISSTFLISLGLLMPKSVSLAPTPRFLEADNPWMVS